MPDSKAQGRLLAALRSCGIRAHDLRIGGSTDGFPLLLSLPDGAAVIIEATTPPLIDMMDPDVLGAAYIDTSGVIQRAWGLAKRLKSLAPGNYLPMTELGPIVQSAIEGSHGKLYFDGYRYYAAPAIGWGAIVFVTNSGEERSARRHAQIYSREAEALKKIGRALNMNQSVVPLCYSAVHEIASIGELAAVLLWIADTNSSSLQLAASIGANRSGTSSLAQLSTVGGSSCVAELVASSRTPLFLPDVKLQSMTADLEGRICYLEPGGISVWPLVTGGSLIGVLELIGREGDDEFEDRLELFQTIAEHLALAINSTVMFENFERLASHDPLTGLANHRTLHEFLGLRLAESQRTNAEIGLIMIDVDHFRSFNEEEGHDTGDHVLRIVADAIKSIVRPYDLAARYGGEEFTVVLPGSGRESSFTIAERIRKKVESSLFETRTGRQRNVTASLGFAVYPQTAIEGGALLRAADAALYEAKRAGRNRVVFYEGAFEDKSDTETMELDALWRWVPSETRSAIRARLDRIEDRLKLLGQALRLSNGQCQMIRAMALIEGPYREATERGDAKRLRAIERLSEFRVLEPLLIGLGERFDGRGPLGWSGNRIPFLSRAFEALLEFDRDGGRALSKDPGRFDPEISSLLAEMADAA